MINCWWIRITAAVEVEYSPSVLLPVQIRSASCQTQMDCHSSEHRSWAARWKQPADWKQDRISLIRCDHGPELTDCFWYPGSSSPENRRGEWWGHTHTHTAWEAPPTMFQCCCIVPHEVSKDVGRSTSLWVCRSCRSVDWCHLILGAPNVTAH